MNYDNLVHTNIEAEKSYNLPVTELATQETCWCNSIWVSKAWEPEGLMV